MNWHHLLRRIKTVARHGREYGIFVMIELLWQRQKQGLMRSAFLKTDVLAFYDFVCLPPVEPSLSSGEAADNTMNWVIPPFGKGSGGHLNIFRFVSNLEKMGFECRIIIVGAPQPTSAEQARKEITNLFFPLAARVFIGIEGVPAAHYTIATEWRTAYWVRSFSATRHRCYFVQDFEPWFFPMGSEYVFAEETYRFGFVGITAGGWLKEKLASEYGMQTHAVGFSYDRDFYQQTPRRGGRNEQRVFFYARPPTSRRGFELGLLALNEVSRRMPDVEVVFAGWDISGYAIPFKHRNAGLLSLDALPDLYSQCDVALVISLSNLSLLPLELMACGTPVVSNQAPWTEWLLNKQNARLAPATVTDLADALCAVLNDPSESNRLREGGFATVAITDWNSEACKMAEVLRGLDGTGHAADSVFSSVPQ